MISEAQLSPRPGHEAQVAPHFDELFRNTIQECLVAPLADGLPRYALVGSPATPSLRTILVTTSPPQRKPHIPGNKPPVTEVISLRDQTTRDVASHKIGMVAPRGLLRDLIGFTETPEQALEIADFVFTSPDFRKAEDFYAGNKGKNSTGSTSGNLFESVLGRRLIRFCMDEPANFDSVTAEVFARLSGENGEAYKNLPSFMERAVTRRVQDEKDASTEATEAAVNFCWELEHHDLLQTPSVPLAITGSVELLMDTRFAEILLHKLSHQSAEVTSAEERKAGWLARLVIKSLLDRYETEPGRHAQNVGAIKKNLFPDPKRADTLSRQSLINLSNTITSRTNPDQRPLSPSDRGAFSLAFKNVLSITTTREASQETHEAHRLEDTLYAEVIGMLLEQRNYPVLKESANA